MLERRGQGFGKTRVGELFTGMAKLLLGHGAAGERGHGRMTRGAV